MLTCTNTVFRSFNPRSDIAEVDLKMILEIAPPLFALQQEQTGP